MSYHIQLNKNKMKKLIFPATLLAMITLTTVSCQKEVLTEPTSSTVENSAMRTIRYTVNGTAYRQVIHSDEDLDVLMSTLFALAREGYTVRLMDENSSFNEMCTKETITYTTENESDAKIWAHKKTLEGYTVTITFNPETEEYTCTAVR